MPPGGSPTAVNKHIIYYIRNNDCITYDLQLVYGSTIQPPFVNDV